MIFFCSQLLDAERRDAFASRLGEVRVRQEARKELEQSSPNTTSPAAMASSPVVTSTQAPNRSASRAVNGVRTALMASLPPAAGRPVGAFGRVGGQFLLVRPARARLIRLPPDTLPLFYIPPRSLGRRYLA